MSALPAADVALIAAVQNVDLMDLAGRIIANPRRARVSTVDSLALALAIEQLQGIAIEADVLVRALAMPDTGDQHQDAVKDDAVQAQMDRVRDALAMARGENNTTGE